MKTISYRSRGHEKHKKHRSYGTELFGPNPWSFILTIITAILTVVGGAYILGTIVRSMW